MMLVLLDAEAVGCQGRGEGLEENGRREIYWLAVRVGRL